MTEPIFIAYAALGLMALVPIYIGSKASVESEKKVNNLYLKYKDLTK